MDIKTQLLEDIKAAMKSGDKARLQFLRLVSGRIKDTEKDKQTLLNNDDVLAILSNIIKQCQESLSAGEQAGREDMVTQANDEIALLRSYLPEPLTESELTQLIDDTIAHFGECTIKDMGKIMAALKEKTAHRADMGLVSRRIKERLSATL